jgi:hypothetical protein
LDAKALTALVRIFAEAIADRYRAGGRALGAPCEGGAITFVQRLARA